LYAFATDITQQHEGVVIFNSQESRWANVNVIEAVCASAALPFAYTPRQIKIPSLRDAQMLEDHWFIDGGLLRNRPIDYFDEMQFQNPYMDDRWRFQQRTNRQTLALCLEKDQEVTIDDLAQEIKQLKSDVDQLGLSALVWRMSKIFYNAEHFLQALRHDLTDRAIIINVHQLGTTDFEVVEDSAYLTTIKEYGEQAARRYFKLEAISNNNNTASDKPTANYVTIAKQSGSPIYTPTNYNGRHPNSRPDIRQEIDLVDSDTEKKSKHYNTQKP
jgi:hypothetical protein